MSTPNPIRRRKPKLYERRRAAVRAYLVALEGKTPDEIRQMPHQPLPVDRYIGRRSRKNGRNDR